MITTAPTENSNLKADYNFGYIWLISVVAALGGLLFGYDWVVIGGAKVFFERYFHIADNAQLSGWANSCALIGCLVGALVAGALSDKFGRKKLLLLSAFLFAITSLGNALAPNFAIFVAWRMLGVGLAVFQQWCGINVIFNYAEEIFKAAGYDISSVLKNIAWTGSVNMAFTFVALGTVDRFGRRPLMQLGAADRGAP